MWPLQGIVSVLFLIIISINYTFPCMQVNSVINKKKFSKVTARVTKCVHVVNSEEFTYMWTRIDKTCHLFMF